MRMLRRRLLAWMPVLAACEAGLICVPGERGAVVFGPVGVEGQGLREAGLDLAKVGILPAGHFAQGGHDEQVEGYEAADGIAGEAEDEAAAVFDVGGGEGDRFAGLHADTAVVHGAGVFEERFDQVEIAHGDAAGCQEDVGLHKTAVDAELEGFLCVAGDAQVDRLAAGGVDGGQEHGAVAVADLAGAEGFSGLDEFVAGGEDGHFGTGVYGYVDDAGGGEQADFGGVEALAGGQYCLAYLNVYAYLTHVGAGFRLLIDANPGRVCGGIQAFRLFDHDDSVGPIGQGGTGCNVGDGTGFDGEGGKCAGADLSDLRIVAGTVGGDDCVSVHRRGGEGRQRFAGGDVGGEDGAPYL